MLSLRNARRAAAVAVFGLVGLCFLWGCAQEQPSNTGTVITVHELEAQMDLPMAIASADAIVMGTVNDEQWTTRGVQMSEWGWERQRALGYSDAEIEQRISFFDDYVYTHSRFQIERALKGEFPEGAVEIWCTGGEFEGHSCEAPGRPQLSLGTRYILFIGRAFYGGYAPLAIYEISNDRATSTSQGRNDDVSVSELIAIISEHKDDPFPWTPSSEELRNTPSDEENQR